MSDRDNNQGGGNQSGGSGSSSGQRNSQTLSGNNYSGQYQDSRMDPNHEDYDPNWTPGPVGSVQDPQNDGRLSENREAGRTKGTTEHSAQAPHVDKDNSGSINNQSGSSGGNFGGSGNQGGGGNN